MKYFLVSILSVMSLAAQTYVTINGPIASGLGTGWSGNVIYSHPAWTCGDTSVGPETITIRVRAGIFSQAMLADCPGAYEITYVGTSSGKAFWTIPSTLGPSATIRQVQSDYVPTPFWQVSDSMLALAPGGAGKCRGGSPDGKSWVWLTCGGGGGGGGTWGSIAGTLTLQLDLKTALDGKADLSHGHSISQVVSLQSELNGKEPTISAGAGTQYWTGNKSWATLDLAAVSGLVSALAAKASSTHAANHAAGQPDALTLDLSQITNLVSSLAAKQQVINWGEGVVAIGANAGADFSILPRWSTGSGPPNWAAPAGSEIYRDAGTGWYYLANGTTSWDLLYRAGMQFQRADVPPSAGSGYGGVQDFICADGQHAKSLSAGVFNCTADSGGGGGGTTGLYAGTLNFATAIPPGGCAVQTFTATGLAAGRVLLPGWPAGLAAYLEPRAKASAADTVQIQICNRGDGDITPGSASYSVRDMQTLGYLSASSSIDWGSLAPGQCTTNTVTITGAAAGDNVAGGWPAGLATGITPYVRISAANTATIQLCSHLDGDYDPPSGTYTVVVSK
ncbi:MAG: hypothetical protein QM757_16630 [Paludibaculum sp.]